MNEMINFTVGPVQSNDEVRAIGAEQVPYFRTDEFSQTMLENERLMKKFSKAEERSRVVFITGSGTASMEAAIINTLSTNDKVLVVNGGSFGRRFVEILNIYNISFDEIQLSVGQSLTEDILNKYDAKNYTAFVINAHETSTGVHYNLDLIHNFCAKNNLFLIVDAISAFLADEINMRKCNIDLMIASSQKALACPPGISMLVLSRRALERIATNKPRCLYFDLKIALENGERGQTPFTPAVGILRQINIRLKQIDVSGGVEVEIRRIANLANYFRSKIRDLPFEMVTNSPSNAVTSLHPTNAHANDIFLELKNNYGIWVCPNGGNLKEKIFRVGHIGNLTTSDYDKLIVAFEDLKKKGKI